MALDSVRVRWVAASGYLNPPEPRCGHVAVSINSREVWGEEFLVVHGGINKDKDALEDLVVLQYDQEAWFQPGPSAVGPAARAFHAGCSIDRKLYVFGGHVYVKQQHKLHQFNDLWMLNTDSWEWNRVEVPPDAPQPCPRDRATLVALGSTRLLLYGGADALNRRLDDLWVFDLLLCTWSEVKTSGAKPRPRCCTSLVVVEDRILMFGGDSYGVTSELWSLRGLLISDTATPKESLPQWTQLTLEGPAPPPRRGHAAAVVGQWVVYMGGLTEQKSMLGMKSKNEYLADVVVLEREAGTVAWKGVEGVEEGEGPVPREKHSLTALAGGRLLLFGGTDGHTTLADAWWLHLEDVVAPTPHAITASSLDQAGPFQLPPAAQQELSQQYDAQQQQYVQYQLQYNQQQQAQQAQRGGGGWAGATNGGALMAGADTPHAAQQAQQAPAATSAGFSYLPSSLATTLPAVMPSGLSYAFNSFKERLGLPSAGGTAAGASPAAAAGGQAVRAAGAHTGAAAVPDGAASSTAAWYRPPAAAAAAAAVHGLPGVGAAALPPTSTSVDPARDEGLLAVGQRALLRTLGQEGGGRGEGGGVAPSDAAVQRAGWSDGDLVLAARQFLASCRPQDLQLGDLPVLMADYRRLARIGWAQVVYAHGGLEAVLQGQGGDTGDLLQMPGRFLHLAAEDLRLREIPELLADYQMLLASQTPDSADRTA